MPAVLLSQELQIQYRLVSSSLRLYHSLIILYDKDMKITMNPKYIWMFICSSRIYTNYNNILWVYRSCLLTGGWSQDKTRAGYWKVDHWQAAIIQKTQVIFKKLDCVTWAVFNLRFYLATDHYRIIYESANFLAFFLSYLYTHLREGTSGARSRSKSVE